MEGDAFTSVFVGLRQRLKRIATGILGDSDDAEDALQDAFCRLWSRRDRIAGSSEVEALSVTTVHNVCIDALRRQSHSPTVSLDENRDAIDCADDDNSEASRRASMKTAIRTTASTMTQMMYPSARCSCAVWSISSTAGSRRSSRQ